MFGPLHYIPILRSKEGEMYALERLRDTDRERITPLIELTPRIFRGQLRGNERMPDPDPGEVLIKQARKLLRSWRYRPFFLDLCHLDGKVGKINGRHHPLCHIAETARSYKMKLIPVTGLRRSEEYQSAVSQIINCDRKGACLRINAEELMGERSHYRICALVERLALSVPDSDLLIDCGKLEECSPPLAILLEKIPDLKGWRTVTVASGAFPEDLQAYRPGMHEIMRHDWLRWKSGIQERSNARRPSFGDYAIQYGLYKEPVDNCNPSASIRYTLESSWLVMRGEALRKSKREPGPGSAQWIANAMLLCERDDFYGPDFSDGDSYIFTMKARVEGPHGTPMTWIRAGLNHHLTVVARQLESLRAV